MYTLPHQSECGWMCELFLSVQESGRPDAAALASEQVQDSGADVDDLMAQLQALGQQQ